MSDKFNKSDDIFSSDEEMTEIENLYQSLRKDDDEPSGSEDAGAQANGASGSPKDALPEQKPKYARSAAPEQENGAGSKYARIAEPSPMPQEEKAQEDGSPKKKRGAGVIISRIVLAVSVIVFAVSAGVLLKNYVELRKNSLEAQSLALLVTQPEQDTDAVGADGILEKYREAYNKNNDLVGWIKVPNTKIDHPVVQASDNDFYLRRNFSKQYERRGSIFMDYECDPKNYCTNTILYGHNYLDSTMFSDLEKYKDLEFYKSAPVIEFNSIYRNQKWKVFGVYLSNADEKDDNGYALYYIYPFMSGKNFDDYIKTVRERSIINMPVDVNSTDKILTLSTCTRDMDIKGHGQTNARCVISARLVREGEREDVNVAAATYNENPRYPQIWYTAHNKTNPYVDASRWYPEGIG